MKYVISFILILATISSCSDLSSTDFPDQIKTTKTSKHIQISGTKIFAVIPSDFQFIKELIRYQKSDNLYFQVIEMEGSNFVEAKPNFTREAIEAKGAKIDVIKNLTLNNFEAIYCEGPSQYPNETKIMFFFGDESFATMIVGVCKTDDQEGKKELQEIFKTIYYDKALHIDPFALASFEFDQTITNFKYAMKTANMFIYTENGKEDLQSSNSNMIQIQVMPKMTVEKAEYYANDVISRYEKNGIKLEDKTLKSTTINNNKAFELETQVTFNGMRGLMYQAVIIFDKSTIVLMASAQNDFENYLDKFKRTAETLKLK